MSFSKDSKKEILENDIEDADIAQAFLSGFIHACGNISRNSEGLYIEIDTDFDEIYIFLEKIIKKLYGFELIIEKCHDFRDYYRIIFPSEISMQLLKDCSLLQTNEDGLGFSFNIDFNLLQDEETQKAFIKGVYVGSATSNIKITELGSQIATTGYHIEFTSSNLEFLKDFQKLLNQFNISCNIVSRKKNFVLYLADKDGIKDLLAIVGAYNSALNLSDEMAKRQLRNTVNRQVNCINYNINKTVEASMKQIQAIKFIDKKIGLDSLPEDLQEVAVLRLANPHESIVELLQLSTLKLTKGGLNHRFNRIIKIANLLKD